MDSVKKRQTKTGRRAAAKPMRPDEPESTPFYETMPFALGGHYIYRDDRDAEPADVPVQVQPLDDPSAAAKRMLVISLITLAVMALVLGIAFAAGLNMLQNAIQSGEVTSIAT